KDQPPATRIERGEAQHVTHELSELVDHLFGAVQCQVHAADHDMILTRSVVLAENALEHRKVIDRHVRREFRGRLPPPYILPITTHAARHEARRHASFHPPREFYAAATQEIYLFFDLANIKDHLLLQQLLIAHLFHLPQELLGLNPQNDGPGVE